MTNPIDLQQIRERADRGETYRRLTYEEKEGRFDKNYDVLVGPDGFECMLGEPEDRTWCRDGQNAVDRLNNQHAEIERLEGQIDLLEAENDRLRSESIRLRLENARLKSEYAASAERSDCRPDEKDMI